jgi:hypothetical protein
MPDSILSPGDSAVLRGMKRSSGEGVGALRRTAPVAAAPPELPTRARSVKSNGSVARGERVFLRWSEIEWVDFTSDAESGSPAPEPAPIATLEPSPPAVSHALRRFAEPPAAAPAAKDDAIPGLAARFARVPVLLPPLGPPVALDAVAPATAITPPSVIIYPRKPELVEPEPVAPPPSLIPAAEAGPPPIPVESPPETAGIEAPLALPRESGTEPYWRSIPGLRSRSLSAPEPAPDDEEFAPSAEPIAPASLPEPQAAALPAPPVKSAIYTKVLDVLDRASRRLAPIEKRLRWSGVIVGAVLIIALAAYAGGAYIAGLAGARPDAAPNAMPNQAIPTAQAAVPVPPPTPPPSPTPPAPTSPAPTANVPPDDPAARAAFYLARAKTGDAKAQYDAGVLYARGDGLVQDYASAASWFRSAAAQGDVAAEYNLGVLYDRGLGVTTNEAEAVNWYRSAADQNHAGAQFNLALAYAEGRGANQDFAAASRWYQRAAQQGLAPAMVNLAILYEQGQGVDRSLIDAFAWYSAAGERGDAVAKARADELFEQFNDKDKARAQGLAATIGAALDATAPPA